jgi:hypothetical protein
MTSEEQANRDNAEESSGPGTPQDKPDLSWKALMDLLACPTVIEGEDPQEFERNRREFLDDLAPVGPAETALAERIVSLSWRLKRAEYVQNVIFDQLLMAETSNPLVKLVQSLLPEGVDLMGDSPETNPDLAVGRMLAKDFSGDRVLDRLLTCEMQIQNHLSKTMAELDRLQRTRKP